MSFDDGKPVERMRMAIDPSIDMEKLHLGLLYVAMSRVAKDTFWVLETQGVDCSRITYVNIHPQMAGRREEDARLEARSAETVRRYARLDNEAMYVTLLRRVDELAADGHRDEESW